MLKNFFSFIKKRGTIINYTSGSLFNSFAQVISNIIILNYVNPDELGIWNSLLLFETYSAFLQGGILNGLNRELPFYLGRKNENYAKSLAGNTLTFFLFSILLCGIIGMVVMFISQDERLIYRLTLIGIVLITMSKFYENYLTSTFRSSHSFSKLSKVYFFRGTYILLSVILVILFGYRGYIIRMVTTAFLTSIFLHAIRPIKVKPQFSLPEISLLFKVGFPIFILSYLYQSSSTLDRLFLTKFSNYEVVGLYSLGYMAYSSFKTLPLSLANYFYPKMSYEYGSANDAQSIIRKAIKINITIFLLMMPMAIITCILLPYLVPVFFSKYEQGITAAQILIFAAVLSGATIGANAIWSMKIWKYIISIQLLGSLFNLIAIYTGVRFLSNKLLGASLGVLTSQFLYFMLTNFFLTIFKRNE